MLLVRIALLAFWLTLSQANAGVFRCGLQFTSAPIAADDSHPILVSNFLRFLKEFLEPSLGTGDTLSIVLPSRARMGKTTLLLRARSYLETRGHAVLFVEPASYYSLRDLLLSLYDASLNVTESPDPRLRLRIQEATEQNWIPIFFEIYERVWLGGREPIFIFDRSEIFARRLPAVFKAFFAFSDVSQIHSASAGTPEELRSLVERYSQVDRDRRFTQFQMKPETPESLADYLRAILKSEVRVTAEGFGRLYTLSGGSPFEIGAILDAIPDGTVTIDAAVVQAAHDKATRKPLFLNTRDFL